MKLIKKK